MKYFKNAYIVNCSSYLPGKSINNQEIDKFIAPINKLSHRIKNKILLQNGITSRYYGINEFGESLTSVKEMSAKSIKDLLNNKPINFLTIATTGGDAGAPGIANFVQNELNLPPLETLSISGICGASMGALSSAAEHTDRTGENSISGASEFPSRLFKKERFNNRKEITFDSHFLRWMLSDGAGACRIENKPIGKSLKINWIHNKSFSADFPACMQIGLDEKGKSYLDYDNLNDAEYNGAFDLKQDIRLLPALFDIGIGEYVKLINENYFKPEEIKSFICHYSSEKFKGLIKELMEKANLLIDETVWFSNLKTCGNTGSASIYIMLEEFWRTKLKDFKHGDKILLFVPESGRFSVSYALLEVVEEEKNEIEDNEFQKIINNTQTNKVLAQTLRELAGIWQDYRSEVLRTNIAQKIFNKQFTKEDYLNWMENWIPQVREGSVWMHRAMSGVDKSWKEITDIVRLHIGEEQFDWQILYEDYRQSGGDKPVELLQLSPGGQALNSYMHSKSKQTNCWDLLGGIYIIEGTGEKIIPLLLPKIKADIKCSRFLTYHGENDVNHLNRWLWMLESVLTQDETYSKRIVSTAKDVAKLYLLHWEHAL